MTEAPEVNVYLSYITCIVYIVDCIHITYYTTHYTLHVYDLYYYRYKSHNNLTHIHLTYD